MEISSLSASLNTSTSLDARPIHEGQRLAERTSENSRPCHHHHGRKCGRNTALHVFRQELRSSLKAQFRAELGAGQNAYSSNQESPAPGDVADEALGVARQVVAQSPTTAAKSLIQFRARVHESVQVARQTVGNPDDMADVEKAMTKVDDGIASMEKDAAATQVSSSSVLEVDTRTRQRTSIKIRTQEGDVIKLSFKQSSELSASSAQSAEGNTASSETEIEFSSRSRMVMKVRGDLNEAEMGAIQGVLGQAQEMADAFFGGDIGAAFNAAGGFSFDSDQLANVNMRFRMRQVSNISYRQTDTPAALPQDPTPAITPPPVVEAPPAVRPTRPTSPVVADAPIADDVPVAETPVTDVPAIEEPDIAVTPTIPVDALGGFFEMVGNFLRSVSEGFEGATVNSSIRFQHSESFKLSLLQSVIHAVAPDEASGAAETAVEAIEQLKEIEA